MTAEEMKQIVLEMFQKEKRTLELFDRASERDTFKKYLERVSSAEQKFLELTKEK